MTKGAQDAMLDPLCADFSRDRGEQLFGTVKPTATWLLLEYDGRWEPDAFQASAVPDAVKAHLLALVEADPKTRIQVIRQKPRLAPEGFVFYVALPRETGSALYRFRLAQYEDLLALDIPAICAQDARYDAQRVAEPLFLVCTHGRRDRCCARYGVPVYQCMAARGGAAVWQTSHVGGHRFAANVVCLPEGIVYGRVGPDRAPTLVDAYRAGHIAPDLLRGRAAYPRRVQAAEALLRLETALTERDTLRYLPGSAEDVLAVRFASRVDGAVHTLHLAEAPPQHVLTSCGDASLTVQRQYSLVRHTVEARDNVDLP